MMKKYKDWADKNLQGDKVIWAVVFALSLISIMVVYSSVGTLAFKRSSSPEQILIKHTLHVLIGLTAMWLAHRVDYRYYSKLSRYALWICIPLLLYTWRSGTSVNDASRWIEVPLFGSFQPNSIPTDNSIARYFVGTRPMNMMSIQVINNKIAVDMLFNAISPQIIPHQKRIGISDSLISSIFCCLFDNMLARFTINARLAKSDG